jgi:hypothetical protein
MIDTTPTIIARDIFDIKLIISNEMKLILNNESLYDVKNFSPYLHNLISKVLDTDNLSNAHYYPDVLVQDIITYYIVEEVLEFNTSHKFSNSDRTLFLAYDKDQLDFLVEVLDLNVNSGFNFYMKNLTNMVETFLKSVLVNNKINNYYFKSSLNGNLYLMSFYFPPKN